MSEKVLGWVLIIIVGVLGQGEWISMILVAIVAVVFSIYPPKQ